MAQFNVQEFLADPSIRVLSESNLTKPQWIALAGACGINVSSGTAKAQVKCVVIQALMDSDKVDEELEEAQELLNVAQAQLKYRQEQMTKLGETSDAEAEFRRIAAEENLIKLRVQASREREKERKKEDCDQEMELISARSKLAVTLPNINQGIQEPVFDVVTAQYLMPIFTEDAPDEFFDHFEKVASLFGWPKDKWAVLIQTVLIGRGKSVYLALTLEQCRDYEEIKRNVLKVYQMTPERCNEKFRSRKDEKTTFLDHAYEVKRRCKRWLEAANVKTVDEIKELIIMEQFLKGIPEHTRAYLREKEVTKLDVAVALCEEYNITNKPNYNVKYHSDRYQQHTDIKSHVNYRNKFSGNPTRRNTPQQSHGKPSSTSFSRQKQKTCGVCFECGRAGHYRRDCHQTQWQSNPVGQAVKSDQVKQHPKRTDEKTETKQHWNCNLKH